MAHIFKRLLNPFKSSSAVNFPDLPFELRVQIWELYLESELPRYIFVQIAKEQNCDPKQIAPRVTTNTHVPPILHVNRLSRRKALIVYKLALKIPGNEAPNVIYVNPIIDTLIIRMSENLFKEWFPRNQDFDGPVTSDPLPYPLPYPCRLQNTETHMPMIVFMNWPRRSSDIYTDSERIILSEPPGSKVSREPYPYDKTWEMEKLEKLYEAGVDGLYTPVAYDMSVWEQIRDLITYNALTLAK